MQRLKLIITLFLLQIYISLYADVYIILYATFQGKTGHIGVAVDEYKIKITDINLERQEYRIDTVKTGYLTYYDLWPKNESLKLSIAMDQTPKYYKLPDYKINNLISINTLLNEGIPHKINYPVDGILLKKTKSNEDYNFSKYIEKIILSNRSFNALKFNCTDFVIECLKYFIAESIVEPELVFTFKVNTPNKYFKYLINKPGFVIFKDPKEKINGSFVNSRIIYNAIKLNQNENNIEN